MIIGRGAAAWALLALMVLTGCGGRRDGLLVPLGDIQSPGRRIDVLVATTRSSVGASAGQMFTGERSEDLAFADISVSVPPDAARQIGEVQWPEQAPGDPAKDFVTLRADRIDLKEALQRFHVRIAATPKRRALVFVHGYNTRFAEAVYRLAQIVNDSQAPSRRSCLRGRRAASCSPMRMTARAPITRAMRSKTFCRPWPPIPPWTKSPCSPIRWETGPRSRRFARWRSATRPCRRK